MISSPKYRVIFRRDIVMYYSQHAGKQAIIGQSADYDTPRRGPINSSNTWIYIYKLYRTSDV